jgi:hypothetical protein
MAPITNLSVESSDQFATPEMDQAIARLAAEDPELALVLLAQRQAAQAEEDRVISQTETGIVTASDAFEDFANLSVEQQNSYAEAMFVNGLGDGLGIETVEDIHEPINIYVMLERALIEAEQAFAIGREMLPRDLYGGQGALSPIEQKVTGQTQRPSLRNALEKLDEKKPSIDLYDPATLTQTAQSYFQDVLGRDATEAELRSFTAGIHAAQKRGEKGAALGVSGRAREFALQSDPERARGISLARTTSRAMKALGMN